MKKLCPKTKMKWLMKLIHILKYKNSAPTYSFSLEWHLSISVPVYEGEKTYLGYLCSWLG